MSKRLVCLLTAIILIFSMTSCSLIGGFVKPDEEPNPTPDSGNVEQTPDEGDVEGTPDTPADPPEEKPEEKPDEKPDEKPENPVCDCWTDADGDTICDLCGSGGLVPPDIHDCVTFVDGFCPDCGAPDPNNKPDDPEPPKEETKPTIYLAGDSTVKTYEDSQYIAGWGQYLDLFLDDGIKVINAAHGGRSSRSFINEGRLYDVAGSNYTFSQNGGNSIADTIKAGDYLFIQFGHNDDASKISNYTTIYDRMVPLGEPDANGIYPVIPAVKMSTTYLPEEYKNAASDSEEQKALSELAKYGSEYYAYGSGTYKWYLKQYIDFARSVGATPVLVTPVARVKFNSNGEIIGGAGLHGENFAYVQAVRQLAEEENCLLIDLFADSKIILETATPTYANYLMALKPNELTGTWPMGYDSASGNLELGYTGIEATPYNKCGAFRQAAAVASHLISFGENISFSGNVLTTPEAYVHASNLISKTVVTSDLAGLFEGFNLIDPDRVYKDASEVVSEIAAIPTDVTQENYLEIQALCLAARESYASLNVDYRADVTNLATLEEIEAKVEAIIIANRPEATKVVIFKADDLLQDKYVSTVTEGEFTLVATDSKAMDKKAKKVTFTYGDETYTTAYGLSMGGKATFGSNRYISFTVDGPCVVTIAAQSSGSDARTLSMVNSAGATVGSYEAPSSVAVGSVEITEAGTYSVGSAGSGMYVYMIIIEYFE